MRRVPRAELYDRLLTADPPVCALGKPVEVLQRCERRRRSQDCVCRFDANEISDDGLLIGFADLGAYMNGESEPLEVEDFARALAYGLARAATTGPTGDAVEWEAATDRLRRVEHRLRVLVAHEAGLTDRYSDEVDS